jgi:hypothetical protein
MKKIYFLLLHSCASVLSYAQNDLKMYINH